MRYNTRMETSVRREDVISYSREEYFLQILLPSNQWEYHKGHSDATFIHIPQGIYNKGA